MTRLVFDVSSLVRWVGPPVGMIRVEQEFALHALAARPDIVLTFYDRFGGGFRPLRAEWAGRLLGLDAAIDVDTVDHRRQRPAWRRWLPGRYPLLLGLERVRLRSGGRVVAALQRVVAGGRLPFPFRDARGRRCDVVPLDWALGPALRLGPGDVLVSAGYDWLHKDIAAIGAAKRRDGFRLAVLCYDLIPLLFPAFFTPADVAGFRAHWAQAFPLSDLVVCTARRIADDVQEYCRTQGLGLGRIEVMRLGYRVPAVAPGPGRLPAGLSAGRFALFVSTIEPRKGHGLLLEVWSRLLAEGVPQNHGFKLVLVGRRGWQVAEVLARLDALTGPAGMVVHLSDVDDAALAQLYRGAAFCVYPSLYEGFGLPVLEAFAHGKAVIASNRGALPETVGSLSVCLDPWDAEAWLARLRAWIGEPSVRAPYERAIREGFSESDWGAAAARFFALAAGA